MLFCAGYFLILYVNLKDYFIIKEYEYEYEYEYECE